MRLTDEQLDAFAKSPLTAELVRGYRLAGRMADMLRDWVESFVQEYGNYWFNHRWECDECGAYSPCPDFTEDAKREARERLEHCEGCVIPHTEALLAELENEG